MAYGAAVQAAILSGDKSEAIQDILLIDVTPLSLGIETAGGMMTKLVERNTRIPTYTSKTFTTYANNQPILSIQVFIGEQAKTTGMSWATLSLVASHLFQEECLQVELTFHLDFNGILNVSATKIIITNDNGRLSKADMGRM